MAEPTVFYSAPRDASAVERPNTRSVKRVHIALTENSAPAGSTDRALFAACSGAPLDEDGMWPAGRTVASVRCRRSACATRFTRDADRVAARRAEITEQAQGWIQ